MKTKLWYTPANDEHISRDFVWVPMEASVTQLFVEGLGELAEHEFIRSIKLFRKVTGCDLKPAKRIVELARMEHQRVPAMEFVNIAEAEDIPF